MKKITLICLFAISVIQTLRGQAVYCKIIGTFDKPVKYQYAYLLDVKSKSLMLTPITENHFSFNVVKPAGFKTVYLFFEMDSVKSYNYLLEQSRTGSNNRRAIAIEDADLLFYGNAKQLKVNKGKWNDDLEQMNKAVIAKDFTGFIDRHPDSPLSISIIKSLLVINRMAELKDKYDCRALFDKLSEPIKNSPEGKELLEKL